MGTAFLIQSDHPGSELVHRALRSSAQAAGLSVVRYESLTPEPGLLVERIYEQLESADIVIADISNLNPNVMYELGFVHGARRPVIIIADDLPYVPFDVASLKLVRYGERVADLHAFEREMERVFEAALRDPDSFSHRPTTRLDIDRLFISYSHQDRKVLDRLMVHLRPLEREGLVDVWNDTRIEAGAHWKEEVEKALGHARAAILLVSADFLASDFIVDNELPPLLRNAERKGTKIIPVIVKPCRYTRDEALRHLQAINDPAHSLMSLPEVEQEHLLDSIAAAVEGAMRPLE
ncbi:MAG: TIR domain-containing protein [Solirubrobacterales bacterium]